MNCQTANPVAIHRITQRAVRMQLSSVMKDASATGNEMNMKGMLTARLSLAMASDGYDPYRLRDIDCWLHIGMHGTKHMCNA